VEEIRAFVVESTRRKEGEHLVRIFLFEECTISSSTITRTYM
jgi:hypothetical protein